MGKATFICRRRLIQNTNPLHSVVKILQLTSLKTLVNQSQSFKNGGDCYAGIVGDLHILIPTGPMSFLVFRS
ncbi:hypothetical protein DASB73_030550 [Starmerella bacillaris]|uniref:Uncharacterized protein n=1 Tax=Starmerella bacillaris TaxID=1247836 RepID=A0AAV5RLW1_STABA|nr:hypothetical protein DASB73_030550 [Starmerella bacillaris]